MSACVFKNHSEIEKLQDIVVIDRGAFSNHVMSTMLIQVRRRSSTRILINADGQARGAPIIFPAFQPATGGIS